MIIIPAIDIMGGKVVRLFKGEFDKQTIYADDPVEVALSWQEQGAKLIHVVDLDGANTGHSVNIDLIGKITQALKIPVETGGGLRTMAEIRKAFDLGVSRVILGSAAFTDKELLTTAVVEYADKIAVSIDARNGLVASQGWKETTAIPAIEAAKNMEEAGVKTIIFTDIDTDGTLSGPNLASLSQILEAVDIDVIASGGVSVLQDLIDLKGIAPREPYGAIIGKALYDKKVDLKEALTI
ncbi:MAG: 1-(5-phosphoribosyl)-5-[(5-phosphoribosylamino)methylideneamino]imidazole-4-carboxamide isomerase [Candidatus Omnitrophica bacterium]|nr:1-(5-phosphoribosyl)-5-[(5-phosphoribosylamino)methylideneamino]imidazole-4-carboxamide isomerase [Candidatus Omnitrophota bacterium]